MTGTELHRYRDAEARLLAQREFERPLVLEAGAGTGKTTTLVARVLVWVLGPGWEQAELRLSRRRRLEDGALEIDRVAAAVLSGVVAITFTEAAAAEMAERVGSGLTSIERGQAVSGLSPGSLPEDPATCSARARALLGALDHLVVRTIHAFCRRLLATYPLEAGLHPFFEVDADGSALTGIAREVVEARLKTAYADEGDSDYLELAARGIGPQPIADALLALAQDGVPARALEPDPLTPARTQGFLARLRDQVDGVAALLERGLLGTKSGRLKTAYAVWGALGRLADLLRLGGIEDVAWIKTQIDTCLSPSHLDRLKDWSRDELTKAEDEALGGVLPELRRQAGELCFLLVHARRLDPELLALGRRVLLPLLTETERLLRSRGVLTFSALLRDARDLLVRRPDVAERVRAGIQQLLVDEFQDTDRVQCDLVRILALEGSPKPGLFLVGDPKQSIYGWRSADLGAYEGFVQQVERLGGRRCPLVVNYRSAPPILHEVRDVFQVAMIYRQGVQAEFQELLPSVENADKPGFAQIPWAPVEHWVSWTWDANTQSPPRKKTLATDAAELEAAAVARDLVHLHHAHGVAWKEVALLMRSTGELDTYLDALRKARIPYAVERDKSYYRRREVIDASALVRCILDPNDHLALLTLLRSAVVGVPDAALIPLWEAHLPSLVTELDGPDSPKLALIAAAVAAAAAAMPTGVPGLERVAGWDSALMAAMGALAELRDSFEHAPADLFIEQLRSRFLLEATEAARYHGHYRLANLDRFFRSLLVAMEEGGGDPQAILRTLRASVAESREAEEGRPKETAGNAVQVMTIHKAKGLDFGHVYLVGLHQKGQEERALGTRAAAVDVDVGPGQDLWEYALFGAPTLDYDLVLARGREVETAERVRTLYVAMTRAKHRMVLAGNLPSEGFPPPGREKTHAHLLGLRQEGIPPLLEAMIALGKEGRADRFVEAASTWVFPALQARGALAELAQPPRPPLSSPLEVARQQRLIDAARGAAEARQKRPLGGIASADAHASLRAQVAERRFSESGAGDETSGGEGGAALDEKDRLRLAVGSAVHRVLETFDLYADPAVEMARQRPRVAGYLRTLLGAHDARKAEARAQEALDRLLDGHLLGRLRALAPHILARELPVLLPPETLLVEGGNAAMGYVAGAVDLLYRDPDTGELVIVDYKVDVIGGDEASLEAQAEAFAPQARVYGRAVASALGERPRLVLWFVWVDRVWEVGE